MDNNGHDTMTTVNGADSYVSGVSQDTNDSHLISAADRINFLARKKGRRKLTSTEKEDLRNLRNSHSPHLLMKSYHLPGYTYWQDLGQYLSNNHPIFGLCCAHKLHPIGFKVRILSLLGSLLFGLAITNSIYLAFAFSSYDYSYTYWATNEASLTGLDSIDQQVAAIQVTNGNLALWSLGSTLHALYDHVVWEFSSCSCFMEPGISLNKIKRYQQKGVYFVVLSVLMAFGLASVTMILREVVQTDETLAVEPNGTTTANTVNTTITESSLDGLSWDLSFFYSYLVEMSLNYFFYYPLVGLILFTGVLGCCGRIPILGGRPYEMKIEQRENEEFLETMTQPVSTPSITMSHNNNISSTTAGTNNNRNLMMASSIKNPTNTNNANGGDVEMQNVVPSNSSHNGSQRQIPPAVRSVSSGLGSNSYHSNDGTGGGRPAYQRSMSGDGSFDGSTGKSTRNLASVSSTTALPYTAKSFGRTNSVKSGLGNSSHHSSDGSRPAFKRTMSGDGSFRVAGTSNRKLGSTTEESQTPSTAGGSTGGGSVASNNSNNTKSSRNIMMGRPPVVGSGTTALPFTKHSFQPSTRGMNQDKNRPGMNRVGSSGKMAQRGSLDSADTSSSPASVPVASAGSNSTIDGSSKAISSHSTSQRILPPKGPTIVVNKNKPPPGPSLLSKLASSKKMATSSTSKGADDSTATTKGDSKDTTTIPETSMSSSAIPPVSNASSAGRGRSMDSVAESASDNDDTSFAGEDDHDDDDNKAAAAAAREEEMSSTHRRLLDVTSTIDDIQKNALSQGKTS